MNIGITNKVYIKVKSKKNFDIADMKTKLTRNKLHIPANFAISVKLYLLLLLIFGLFRLGLLLTCLPQVSEAEIADILKSFVIGAKFDTTVICFAMAIPVVAVSVATFISNINKLFTNAIIIITSTIFIPTFILFAVDIPYFNQFFMHFDSGAFAGLEGNFSIVSKMIFQEVRFFIMIIPIILVPVIFCLLLRKIITTSAFKQRGSYPSKTIYTIILLLLMFMGMRGNLNFKDRPLHTGMAYFCNNQMLNQLGSNPVFVFVNDLMDKNKDTVEFMSSEDAVVAMQKNLNITTQNAEYPLARQVEFQEDERKLNVVLILMESMTAYNLAYHSGNNNLTPFLDSLLTKSLYFENCYTTNYRTCCGMYSTLASYPALYDDQPTYGNTIRTFNSLPYELKKHGYTTDFFLSHDKNFDNSNAFLLANGYDRIYSQEDYPLSEVKNTYGVCDEFLLHYASKKIDTLANSGKPFFATILTISNHPPYYFDENFEFKNNKDEEKIVEYSDAMLKKFFEYAEKTTWFDSTVFVLIGDHGTAKDATYPLPLSYFHTPLIFYAPNIIRPEIKSDMASQIDVFPTIMGILKLPHTANHLGINLLKEQRQYSCVMNSAGYAILDKEWMMVGKRNTDEKFLYNYKNRDLTNYISDKPKQAKQMENYGKQFWQTTIHLLNKRATKVE